jgi:hypothetical protein
MIVLPTNPVAPSTQTSNFCAMSLSLTLDFLIKA